MPDVVNTKVAFVILLATSGSRPPGTVQILICMSRTQRAKVSKTISIPIGTYTHQ